MSRDSNNINDILSNPQNNILMLSSDGRLMLSSDGRLTSTGAPSVLEEMQHENFRGIEFIKNPTTPWMVTTNTA
jgi:hypothetical protein